MLSTLTPLSESSRGHRYPMTAAWFVLGAVIGGAALGCLLALLAEIGRLVAIGPSDTWLAVTAATAVTLASDLKLPGLSLPEIPRQVDEGWVSRFRSWVYATGYGWQIGAGLTTYVMTAAVYLMMLLAALTTNLEFAFLTGVGFGAARGLTILLGARLTTAEKLRRFHRRFEAADHWSLRFAVAAQCVALGIVCSTIGRGGLIVGAAIAAVLLAVSAAGRLTPNRAASS